MTQLEKRGSERERERKSERIKRIVSTNKFDDIENNNECGSKVKIETETEKHTEKRKPKVKRTPIDIESI